MAIALLSCSFVSIVSFIATIVLGFMIQGRTGFGQHFLLGFFTTFMVTLTQSMTMFYFIGMGKQVKDLVANQPEGPAFVQRTKRFKALVFPPATWAILFTMAAMIIGGGVDTRVLPSWLHLLLAAIALYYNIVATWKEGKMMIEQNILMEELERLVVPGAVAASK